MSSILWLIVAGFVGMVLVFIGIVIAIVLLVTGRKSELKSLGLVILTVVFLVGCGLAVSWRARSAFGSSPEMPVATPRNALDATRGQTASVS